MITREDCFKVGEVAKTHNLQGEVVITTDSDLLEKYADEPVFLLLDGAPVPFFIADEGLTVRNHTSYIVKFDYVDTLAQAGRLVGCEVLFEKELLEGQEPEESGYDIFELIGFEVKDQVSEETGEVADVADYSGNVVLTVSIMNKEILLPSSLPAGCAHNLRSHRRFRRRPLHNLCCLCRTARPFFQPEPEVQIGRASCRERV